MVLCGSEVCPRRCLFNQHLGDSALSHSLITPLLAEETPGPIFALLESLSASFSPIVKVRILLPSSAFYLRGFGCPGGSVACTKNYSVGKYLVRNISMNGSASGLESNRLRVEGVLKCRE